jgi:hypothetical protein
MGSTDFLVRDAGSIFLVEPVSAAAFAHFIACVPIAMT